MTDGSEFRQVMEMSDERLFDRQGIYDHPNKQGLPVKYSVVFIGTKPHFRQFEFRLGLENEDKSIMTRSADKYATFVSHPRYGRRPNITGLNPDTVYGGDTFIHWHSSKDCRIPNTAIPADLTRQTPATVPVTHYYDVARQCRDCGRPFLFFAEEQKHWYEELGFGLDSDCVRCVDCRKRQQGIARKRERYEELFHVPNRNDDETLEMADCCLSLIESSAFNKRQTQRVRMLLNKIPSNADDATKSR